MVENMNEIEYAKKRLQSAKRNWDNSIGKPVWNFYKGQYLMLLEIIYPKQRVFGWEKW